MVWLITVTRSGAGRSFRARNPRSFFCREAKALAAQNCGGENPWRGYGDCSNIIVIAAFAAVTACAGGDVLVLVLEGDSAVDGDSYKRSEACCTKRHTGDQWVAGSGATDENAFLSFGKLCAEFWTNEMVRVCTSIK